MKRRVFLEKVASAAVAAAGPLAWCARRLVPRSVVEAVRVRGYPGPLERLDPKAVGKQGHWAG